MENEYFPKIGWVIELKFSFKSIFLQNHWNLNALGLLQKYQLVSFESTELLNLAPCVKSLIKKQNHSTLVFV